MSKNKPAYGDNTVGPTGDAALTSSRETNLTHDLFSAVPPAASSMVLASS